MSVIAFTVDPIKTWKDKAHVITWASLANGDTGSALEMPGSPDRSVQVTGTFGSGGNLRIQGSNDGSNWNTLTDPQGNDINLTASKIEKIMEVVRYMRPNVTAGDGTTNLTVSILIRR